MNHARALGIGVGLAAKNPVDLEGLAEAMASEGGLMRRAPRLALQHSRTTP